MSTVFIPIIFIATEVNMKNYRPLVKMEFRTLLLTIMLWIFSASAYAQQTKPLDLKYKTELVAKDLGVIWGMTWVSPTKILMTERSGNLYLFDINSKQKVSISGLPKIKISGQGGLLDVASYTDPNKQTWLYFTYVKPLQEGKSATTLARAQLNVVKGTLMNWNDILITNSADNSDKHFGSRITFDADGHVFFGIGDRGNRDNGQNTQNHAATIMRLNLDGTIPKDNPFIKDNNVLDEIWSYGHRNPQGLVYDKKRQILWEVEHGPRGGDEINIIQKGLNYGWAKTSHGKEYWGPLDVGESKELPSVEPPIKVYVPSIAPSSAMIYSGNAFPDLNGNLLIGALAGTHINIVQFDESLNPVKEMRIIKSLNQRIRSLINDNNGLIYFTTDSGNLYRIEPL